MDNNDWLKGLHNIEDDLTTMSYELDKIAMAMDIMGMDRPAIKLRNYAESLRNNSKNISNISGQVTSIMLRDAEQATANMIGGILTAITSKSEK